MRRPARHPLARSAAGCAVLLVVVALAAGCAGTRDALAQSASAAYSAGATARLGLQPGAGLFDTTRTALLDEMTQEAADAVRELETSTPDDGADDAYRAQALDAARGVLDGIHLAARGDAAAATALLDENLDELADLGAGG